MDRRYYLSKFVGDGKTSATAFKAKVSEYGVKWGMLDLRPDPTQIEGWCFAFLDSDNDELAEQDPDLILLGMDVYAELPDILRSRLSQIIGVNLIHTRLVDVITEVLFRQGRIRPAPDGKYQIHLGSLINELSAEKAAAFIGRVLLKEQPREIDRSQMDRARKLSGSLKTSLEAIRKVVDQGESGWL